jgi:surface carbohydrate biosynthesis protein
LFRRELIPKTILATYLSLRGFSTIFGHKWYVTNNAIANAKAGDVYFTSHTLHHEDKEALSTLLEKGVKFVGVEEESVFDSVDYEDQLVSRCQEPEDFSSFGLWMCWGSRDYKVLRNLLPDPSPLRNYGTPRSALLGQFGKEIFSKDISIDIKAKYGDFVLIVTSFMPTMDANRNAVIDLHKGNPRFNLQKLDFQESKINNFESLEKHFMVVRKILRNTKLNIVLRPYIDKGDTHTMSLWKSLNFDERKRVFIDKRPFILPLLIGCNSVLHSGSTVGIESRALGKRTISLNYLFRKEEFDFHDKLSVLASFRPKNLDELIEDISKETTQHEFVVSTIISDANENDFYKLLYEDLISMGCSTNPSENLTSFKFAKRSLLYKIATSLKQGKIHRYDLEKRPHYGRKTVSEIIASTMRTLGDNRDSLKLQKIERDTYFLCRRS